METKLHQSRCFCFMLLARQYQHHMLRFHLQYHEHKLSRQPTQTTLSDKKGCQDDLAILAAETTDLAAQNKVDHFCSENNQKFHKGVLYGVGEKKGQEYYDLPMCKPTLKFKQRFSSINKNKTPQFFKKRRIGLAGLIQMVTASSLFPVCNEVKNQKLCTLRGCQK